MDVPIKKRRRPLRRLLLVWLIVCLVGTLASCVRIAVNDAGKPRAWRGGGGTDARTSAGLAPDPATHRGPVLQVYAARTWGVKRVLSVHTWIVTKRQDAPEYTRYQVIGWRMRRGGSALVIELGDPDRPWYGNTPELLADHRGPEVEAMIDRLGEVVAGYPYGRQYRAWPGPNSNTFTAFVARRLPELGLDLPSTAIGKDYLGDDWIDVATSGDGWQWSAAGLAGLAVSSSVGLELNVLGLNVELDLIDGALEVPGFGRIGADTRLPDCLNDVGCEP